MFRLFEFVRSHCLSSPFKLVGADQLTERTYCIHLGATARSARNAKPVLSLREGNSYNCFIYSAISHSPHRPVEDCRIPSTAQKKAESQFSLMAILTAEIRGNLWSLISSLFLQSEASPTRGGLLSTEIAERVALVSAPEKASSHPVEIRCTVVYGIVYTLSRRVHK